MLILGHVFWYVLVKTSSYSQSDNTSPAGAVAVTAVSPGSLCDAQGLWPAYHLPGTVSDNPFQFSTFLRRRATRPVPWLPLAGCQLPSVRNVFSSPLKSAQRLTPFFLFKNSLSLFLYALRFRYHASKGRQQCMACKCPRFLLVRDKAMPAKRS